VAGPRFWPVTTADIQWLNTAETARRLGVTPRTLYRFIDEGQLPAYRFGRVIRLKESEVADFIERCRIEPGSLEISGNGDDGVDAAQARTDANATAASDA
jgi:excisionase family DNA binding protein